MWLPARCCWSMSGTIISIRRPTSSMSTSVACVRKLTRASIISCCIRFAAPVTVYGPGSNRRGGPMVIEEFRFASEGRLSAVQILRNARLIVGTHAFRLAALYYLVFAASVLGVLLFVYLTSAGFVERQTEATLDAEITGLAEQYAQRGLSGLVQIVAARSAGDRGDGMLYLVTNRDGQPLAGNIAAWPAGLSARAGRLSFSTEARGKDRIETPPAQGALFVIPGRYRLLVGRDISDATAFRDRVKVTLVWAGLL